MRVVRDDGRAKQERLRPTYVHGRAPVPPEPDAKVICDRVMDYERRSEPISKEDARGH